jgi:LytS/YehU family sensor histidine kinase
MAFPFRFMPGLIFDTRSIIISIGGLFGGPITAGVAAALSVLYRVYHGGVGTTMGFAVIIASALLGSVYFYLSKKKPSTMSNTKIYFFGLIVHVVMLLCMFLLPVDIALKTIRSIWIPVIIAYPVISFAIINFLNNIEYELSLEASLSESHKDYQELVDNTNSIIIEIITNELKSLI